MQGYVVVEFKKPFSLIEVENELFSYSVVDGADQHVIYAEDLITGELVAEALNNFPGSEPDVIRYGIAI